MSFWFQRVKPSRWRASNFRGGDPTNAVGDLNTYAIDAHKGVNDIDGDHPIFAPVFRTEGREMKFSFGDFRNLTIDLRRSTIDAFSLVEVLSDTGQFGSGDQKYFLGSVLVDKSDRRVYIDRVRVFYPGALAHCGRRRAICNSVRCVYKGRQGRRGGDR